MKTMFLVIYNPVSGFGLKFPNIKQTIQKKLRKRHIDFTWIETTAETNQHIVSELRQLYDRILVCGGDGTVREIANILISENSKTPLAIIPLGTMNVMAISLNIPLTLKRALRHALTYEPADFDVGLVNNQRHFFIACGIGYDAKVMKATTRRIKRWLGPLSYWLIALSESLWHEPITGTLITDNGTEKINCAVILSFNVKTLIKYHPFIRLKPHPGTLDMLIADSIDFPNVVRLLWYVFWHKTITKPPVRLFTSKTVKFSAAEPVQYELDGDVFQAKDITIKIVPNALRIVCKSQAR